MTIRLTTKELEKYEVIRDLCDGKITTRQACTKLSLSREHVQRLKKKFKEQGKDAFAHKSRGQSHPGKVDEETRMRIIEMYRSEYSDCSFAQFTDFVAQDFGLRLSEQTIRRWLLDAGLCSPCCSRKTRRALARGTEPSHAAHPARARKKYAGEQIQMDASSKEWIEGVTWHLHLAVDNHSRMVLGAWLDEQETLAGYYQCLKQILLNHGIPHEILTDGRTVFVYEPKTKKKDSQPSFALACKSLGITLSITSDPRAKGQIEKMNHTFQNRLPYELKRAKIKSLDEANEFLTEYLNRFNETVISALHDNQSVFDCPLDPDQVNRLLCVKQARVINSGHVIRFENSRWFPLDEKGERIYLKKGVQGFVCRCLDGSLYFQAEGKEYGMEQLEEVQSSSKEFDQPLKKGPGKGNRIGNKPAASHPWRIHQKLPDKSGKTAL